MRSGQAMKEDMMSNDPHAQVTAAESAELKGISDELWDKIRPFIPGGQGNARNTGNDREFIDAVLWILRTGGAWKQLPERFGSWEKIYRRFVRWREAGVWEGLFEIFLEYPEMEWLLLDASKIEVSHGGKHKPVWFLPNQGYICPWMRLFFKSDAVMKRIPILMVRKIAGS